MALHLLLLLFLLPSLSSFLLPPSPPLRPTALPSSNSNLPSKSELLLQQSEALHSLSFHASTWHSHGSTTFFAPTDPAAGLRAGITSSPYHTEVRCGSKWILEETFTFANADSLTRCVRKGANVDVDAADGSYSLDNPAILPPSIMGGLNPAFVVEHAVPVSEGERCRCFLVYGDEKQDGRDWRFAGVVLTEEYRVDSRGESIGETVLRDGRQSREVSPLDLIRIEDKSNGNDPTDMDRLIRAVEQRNDRAMESAQPVMKRHAPGMFGISSGVYLGDTFVREPIPSERRTRAMRQRGFGVSGQDKSEEREEGQFAAWSVGVQKSTLQFKWDYSKGVSIEGTYGKSLGTMNSLSCGAMYKSVGNVVVNEGRAGSREERRVVWDLDGGDYIAGLIGSTFFRAPRYLSFTESQHRISDTHLTEFIVFHRSSASVDEGAAPEDYCSRITRLYRSDGTLLQGSTGFYTMNRPITDTK